ncbi:MAG: hypothetical protein PVF85_11905 [Anaerolineales bacterium]|jgi:hypothetical protein
MPGSPKGPGLFLIIRFNWPLDFKPEYGDAAKSLHVAVEQADWITEVLAASGGLGGEQSSYWIFKIHDYAALDRLRGEGDDAVASAYHLFFSSMLDIDEVIRKEVVFV